MEPFSKHTIESVEDLFGRKELIENLLAYAKRRENIALIGTRRFGKTCIFRSLRNYLLKTEDAPVFPVFLDFKEVGFMIIGTAEVYRFILAKLIGELCAAGFYTKKEDFTKIDIIPSKDWEDNYENLQSLKIGKLNAFIGDIIRYFSGIMEKTILFLIDEYEHLFQKSFSNPEGFMPLRTLSSENEKDKVKPFAFWIAGAVGWKDLCSLIGSAELNVINASLNLMPLEKKDFDAMWKYEVSLCKDKEKCEMLLSKMDFAFQKTGGVPYYAKILGGKLIVEGREPDYTILSEYFDQIYNTLDESERKLLKDIAVLPKNYKDSAILKVLQNKGLIYKVENKFEIRVGYYADYIRTIGNNNSILNTAKTEVLSDDIFSLFTTINEQRKRKSKGVIFDVTNVDFNLYKGLKASCQNVENLKSFISTVYLTFLEKTKSDGKAGNNLPVSIHYGTFGLAIDMLRHVYVGHLEEKMELTSGKMNKKDALVFFLGSDNEPYHPEEFSQLQLSILTKYKEELVKLLNLVRNEK